MDNLQASSTKFTPTCQKYFDVTFKSGACQNQNYSKLVTHHTRCQIGWSSTVCSPWMLCEQYHKLQFVQVHWIWKSNIIEFWISQGCPSLPPQWRWPPPSLHELKPIYSCLCLEISASHDSADYVQPFKMKKFIRLLWTQLKHVRTLR